MKLTIEKGADAAKLPRLATLTAVYPRLFDSKYDVSAVPAGLSPSGRRQWDVALYFTDFWGRRRKETEICTVAETDMLVLDLSAVGKQIRADWGVMGSRGADGKLRHTTDLWFAPDRWDIKPAAKSGNGLTVHA